MDAITVLVGMATVYLTEAHAGNPLLCGGVFADTTAPWVALPISQFGTWRCGDLVYLSFGNGDALLARAMDAGPFGDHCVIRGNRCIPIVADVPEPHWPACCAEVYIVAIPTRTVMVVTRRALSGYGWA